MSEQPPEMKTFVIWDYELEELTYGDRLDTKKRLNKDVRSRPQPPATCAWILDEEYQKYDTGCGNAFECIEGDIEENNFKFCPYCGGKIVGCPITPELNEEKKPGCFGAWGLPSCNTPGCAWFARCKQSREDY